WALPCRAESAAQSSNQKLVITGQTVWEEQITQMAYGTGNVVIVKDNVRLSADRVRYSLKSHDMFADGNVRLTQDNQQLTCESLYYNFDTKTLITDKSRSIQGLW